MRATLVSLFLITSFVISAQQSDVLSVAAMEKDFDLLRQSLEEVHGGMYRFADKPKTDARFNSQRQRITSIKSRREFTQLVAEVLADSRDGHMRLIMDEQTLSDFGKARLFPFSVLIENNRMVIRYNETKNDSSIAPGYEIVKINGQKANDLLKKMYAKLPGDGYIETGKKKRLEQSFGSFYWLLVDTAAQFNLTIKDLNGKVMNTRMAGIADSLRQENRKSNRVNAALLASIKSLSGPTEIISVHFPQPGIAYVRVRGFQGDRFYNEIDSVFNTIQEKKTRSLLLDLRGNGGGVDMYGAFLVSQFVNKPFRYFDRIHLRSINPSFTRFKEQYLQELRDGTVADPSGGFLATTKLHPGVSEQQPGAHPFTGKIFVLTDGGTFSTAADVSALLRQLTNAVFIGEETGGGFEGNTSGSSAEVLLPGSKLKVRIQLYDYWNAVKVKERGRGTLPDHVVPVRVVDQLKGIDKALVLGFELAGKE
ncbi:S41 family peptidase [Terrimonas sp. NA20]|uniref:S41 family peptidase n=1 Tax=Terrimonas ginsenosidimutans TaxID=2908004 RepID=A0ABS9KK41_9BACT|nr:S41 family peptidase [Terrimonas ginsenosidimutans]MCG2612685.1 S41 family peptidase [Terrimonas ginsenosidimutans]